MKRTTKRKHIEVGTVEPHRWQQTLENIREMRKNVDAPVDTMGCHKCRDDDAPADVQRFHVLVSLMLSSQTKDAVTYAAMERLKQAGLNVANVIAMSDDELGELIKPVGFWRSKVRYLKRSAVLLRDKYGSDLPTTVEELRGLPGVGPKMAHLTMDVAWGKSTGIGVDTHVHRISNRLGWVNSKLPEETRKGLEGWLPQSLWSEANHLLVGFGQTICKPVKPDCANCLNCDTCPFAKRNNVKRNAPA